MNIMFICTANICRSSMAQWLCKKKIEEKKIEDVYVYSCGVDAINGQMASNNAIKVMEEYNVDLTKHRSTSIENSNIKEMDLILCATISHKIIVTDMYPSLKEKVYTLKEYVSYKKDGHDTINLSDPWGWSLQTYKHCAKEIDECLDLLLKKLYKKREGEND